MYPHGSRRAFLALLAGAPLLARAASSRLVVYPPPESELDDRSAYRIELLRLALGKRYSLQPGELVMQ